MHRVKINRTERSSKCRLSQISAPFSIMHRTSRRKISENMENLNFFEYGEIDIFRTLHPTLRYILFSSVLRTLTQNRPYSSP